MLSFLIKFVFNLVFNQISFLIWWPLTSAANERSADKKHRNVKNFVTLAQNIEIFNGVRFYIFQNLSVHFPFYDATLGQELWPRHRRWLIFNRCQGNFYKILEKFCKISIFIFSLCDSLEFKFQICCAEMMFPNPLFVLMQFPCNFFQCLHWWRGDCVTPPLFSAFLLKHHFFLPCSLKLMEIHQKRIGVCFHHLKRIWICLFLKFPTLA